MTDVIPIAAEAREVAGKGAARAARRQGRVPGIIYGKKFTPVLISVDPMQLMRQVQKPGFFSHIFEVQVNGEKHRTLARDLQLDPVTDRPLHVDFLRFSADTRINIEVPVMFVNEEESPGIKRGGVLNIVRHTVEMICSPDNIPESITADMTGLEIGDSIHISAIALPSDVQLTITDRDFTIATVAAPSVFAEPEDEVEAEGEEGVEGEEGEEGAEGEAKEGEADAKEGGDGGESKD